VHTVDTVEVRWPSGQIDRYANLAADTAYSLREGSAEVRPSKGWPERKAQSLK
jgi:enediyne biosynthesis protein E4